MGGGSGTCCRCRCFRERRLGSCCCCRCRCCFRRCRCCFRDLGHPRVVGELLRGRFRLLDDGAVEVSFGLERIDNDALYEAGNWEFNSSSNVLDRWGSQPPESYGKAITPFIS